MKNLTKQIFTLELTREEVEMIANGLTETTRIQRDDLDSVNKLPPEDRNEKYIKALAESHRETKKLRNAIGALVGITYMGWDA